MSGEPAPRVLVLFPGALGDLLCCWPALDTLRRTAAVPLTLAAREAWLDALPENAVASLSLERRELADLFSTAPLRDDTRRLLAGFARVESFTGHGDRAFAARLKASTGAPVAVHPFRALRDGEHAAEYYARCLGVTPARASLPVRTAAAQWAATFWERHGLDAETLVIHAGSGGKQKNWEGMPAVAETWRARRGAVVALLGPAEEERASAVPHDVAVRGEPLDRVAALLARARGYLGNDSGISHLAGMVGGRGVALFGPTDPSAWRPLGSHIRVLHAPTPCRRCGSDRFCTHRLAVGDVLAAMQTG